MKKLLLFVIFLATAGLTYAQPPCAASFTLSPAPSGNNLLRTNMVSTATFGTFTNSYGTTVVNFGDGTPPATYYYTPIPNIQHIYTSPGVYNVGMRVNKYDSLTSALICTDTITQTYTVSWPACGATITKIHGANGLVTFTALNPASSIGINYYWNFDDGSPIVMGNPVSHTYANGNYTCTLLDTIPGVCNYVNTSTVPVTNSVANCSLLHSSFNTGLITAGSTYFSATSNYVSGLTRQYNWTFGDGTTLTTLTSGSNHFYTPGTYTISLKTVWLNSANVPVCQDSTARTIAVYSCAPQMLSFTSSAISPNSFSFSNTSAPPAPPLTVQYTWLFGDNTSDVGPNVTHTYTTPGTYTVAMASIWSDSISYNYCIDTAYNTVTVTLVSSSIGGNIVRSASTSSITDTFKVWLITMDSTLTILQAIDSIQVSGGTASSSIISTPYTFPNILVGLYRVKAARINGAVGVTGPVPTYADSTLYWNSAHIANVIGANPYWPLNVFMQSGITTSGPGFVGGNVSLGANKGTAAGISNLQVFLLNQNGILIAAANTNTNGDYSFSNIPVGSYKVYPEHINYLTTAYDVAITPGQTSVGNVDFNQDNAQMNIKPRLATGVGNSPLTSPDFSIYPNPAKNTLRLVCENMIDKTADLIITNITGQVVLRKQMTVVNGSVQLLDVSHLKSGLYFVRMQSEHSDRIQKIAIGH